MRVIFLCFGLWSAMAQCQFSRQYESELNSFKNNKAVIYNYWQRIEK